MRSMLVAFVMLGLPAISGCYAIRPTTPDEARAADTHYLENAKSMAAVAAQCDRDVTAHVLETGSTPNSEHAVISRIEVDACGTHLLYSVNCGPNDVYFRRHAEFSACAVKADATQVQMTVDQEALARIRETEEKKAKPKKVDADAANRGAEAHRSTDSEDPQPRAAN